MHLYKALRPLQPDEIQAVLRYVRKEPPGPAIREIASRATWWEVQLDGPNELGQLHTLWHRKRAALTTPNDASTATVAIIADQIRGHAFGRPGLQGKVSRYRNRIRATKMDIKIVLEERPWGTFIQEGTARAVAGYLLHLQGEALSDLFPLRVVAFKLGI